MLEVARNQRPGRLPVYEHVISPFFMEKVLGHPFADLYDGDILDIERYFECYCDFFRQMTYDTVSFEVCLCSVLPGAGALFGGTGPIQNRDDFTRYPWSRLQALYWEHAQVRFEALIKKLPEGMKIVGGGGNGVFEISEDLVGLEALAYMQVDDPGLFADLYRNIGELLCHLWKTLLDRYADSFAICRFGDDLGFKSGTLTSPAVIRNQIVPQHKRIVDRIKSYDKPFLLHSCGNIFDVMNDLLGVGIDLKHSNEDVIAPFDRWIDMYGHRIGLVGGIDVDLLCKETPDAIKEIVFEAGKRYREAANGFALGSGNSIPDYVPVEAYMAMIEAAIKIREQERTCKDQYEECKDGRNRSNESNFRAVLV
jgi:uroporphyrinogen decarboxylase